MRNILNISHGWIFVKDMTQAPANIPQNGEKIDLPHTWNAQDGQDGGNDYFRGTCCYARSIKKADLPQGQKYYLQIHGANSSADVYMNGKHLAHHDGGYSTWRVDISNTLRNDNCLVILVDNASNELVYPQTADFTFYGGLYRGVDIIAVPDTHFELDRLGCPGIYVTPVMEGSDAKVELQTYIMDQQQGDSVCFRILDAQENEVFRGTSDSGKVETVLKNVHLWDGVKDPYLYTAQAVLLRGDQVLDQVSARFGCRSFEIHPEKGFILNGREYPLRGVSRHQDRWQLGNALLPEHHLEDMNLICELGANTIRLAHYQHDQYFYDLCDERGMVVWAEIPYISRHMPEANSNTQLQMKELITQCYNHPSIVVWGLSNEITMDGAKDPDMIQTIGS